MRCKDIYFTTDMVPWRDKVRTRGQGDLTRGVSAKTIVEDLEQILNLLKDSEFSKLDRMYEIRYIRRYNRNWVVDGNRKLLIAKELERNLGIEFTTQDVTNMYEISAEELSDIHDLMELHEEAIIYLPTFKPEIQFTSNHESYVGRRQLANFRRRHYRKEDTQKGLTSWFNVENAWFFFPFYLVLTVVVIMVIILGHLIIFGNYETEKIENPGYNKVEL